MRMRRTRFASGEHRTAPPDVRVAGRRQQGRQAPQALPLGFVFAGAPAVISSLWAVDDASTKELMTDFHGRLLAGETDELAAFTAAKKALRAKYPDPFHWAPFLYAGNPD